ncbi:hypothetical protein AAIG97_32625, partial [Pseudomonas aeruginosa]|uniref:ParA family protein n=1 Tax=Pseudomonas aeruginosa TaxID=287 RepID=UPI0031B7933D
SSYYELPEVAQGGIYDLLAANITDPARIISRTIIPNLDVVISNDQNNQLNNLLLQAPDGRLRLANLMPALKEGYDLVLIDTQGARASIGSSDCRRIKNAREGRDEKGKRGSSLPG